MHRFVLQRLTVCKKMWRIFRRDFFAILKFFSTISTMSTTGPVFSCYVGKHGDLNLDT